MDASEQLLPSIAAPASPAGLGEPEQATSNVTARNRRIRLATRVLRSALCCAALLLATCGEDTYSLDELLRDVAAAHACDPGDACAAFTGRSCFCADAVNADQLERIEALAASVDCTGGPIVLCEGVPDPHCEAGRCVRGDEPPAEPSSCDLLAGTSCLV